MTAVVQPTMDGTLRRLWSAPLWAHAAALAAVLVVGVLATNPGVAYSSDEGAAVLQARVLEQTGDWAWSDPLADVVPDGAARPFVHGDAGDDGVAPYAKHPLYPLVLRGADAVAGPVGLWLTAVLGTFLAALAAAALARRIDPGLARPALWVTGAACPLLVDGWLVLAHTLAAASAALAVVLAVDVVRGRPAPWRLAGIAAAVAVTAGLRSEGLLLGPALAVTALAVTGRRRGGAVAAAAVAGSAITWLVERFAVTAVIGRPLGATVGGDHGGWLAGRAESVVATWLDPGYGTSTVGEIAVGVALVALTFGVLAHRANPARRLVLPVAAAVAVACWVVRLVAGPPGFVPGLVVAFPVGWAAVLLARRQSSPAASIAAVTAAVLSVGIVLTQYARGGGVEWGGRYFAIVVPIAVPALLAATVSFWRSLGSPDRRVVVAAVVALSLLTGLAGLRAVRTGHDATRTTLDRLAAGAAATGDEHPVVLSRWRLLPQLAWTDFDRYRWAVAEAGDLAPVGEQLADAGVDRILLATTDPATDLALVPGWRPAGEPVGPSTGSPMQVLVLERP